MTGGAKHPIEIIVTPKMHVPSAIRLCLFIAKTAAKINAINPAEIRTDLCASTGNAERNGAEIITFVFQAVQHGRGTSLLSI